ncbi:MAG: tryptophan--tRNA ligase [Lutispora sp.]|nr:tryptophan--tRNA ligase [Lutispora sp.]MDD4834588.1 tryptophan--tRNA ligase [Lutispora sp.]
MEDKKKVIFSGIQPSGDLTIGNYLGALINWSALQNDYDSYYCVVDLHALTIRQEPKELRARTLKNIAIYVASGLDPEKNTLFIQSHVPAHSEAAWLLNCFCYMGELGRMTQYKDKSQKVGESVSAGLFTYPVLMAADILLYNTDLVPVGADQKQHIELARDLAIRFNNLYSPTFTIPEPYIADTGAKIMDLQEPEKKMSKSADNPNAYILILDPPEVIRKKISRAVTDDLGVVRYNEAQPGVSNLISILSTITNKKPEEIVKDYEGIGYAKFKSDVADALVAELQPVQNRVKELLEDKTYMESIYKSGAEKANYVANKTLRKMQKKLGIIPR